MFAAHGTATASTESKGRSTWLRSATAPTRSFLRPASTTRRVVGGVRARGPISPPMNPTHVLEWSGQPGLDAVRKMITDRVPFGVVEMKTAWVTDDPERNGGSREPLARSRFTRWLCSTFNSSWRRRLPHVLNRWRSSGGRRGVEDSRDAVSGPALPDEDDVVGPQHIRQSCGSEAAIEDLRRAETSWHHDWTKSTTCAPRGSDAMSSGIDDADAVQRNSSRHRRSRR